jgi:hypothetical protein
MSLWICSSDRRVVMVDISTVRRWAGIMVCGSSSGGSRGVSSARRDRASAALFWLPGR